MQVQTGPNRQINQGNSTNPFDSFWMAGFECTDQLNAFGNRVDFLHITGHYEKLEDDYQKLQPFGIRTVREGIRWSFVEKKPYCYDWTTVKHMMDIAKANGIQQVWDICHFGFPDDITPLHPMFARRFAAICRAFVEFYRSQEPDRTLIVTPINEVSFLSWLGGDVHGTSPYCRGQGWEVKYHLMKAYIEGIAAMREVDPHVRILTTEPLVQMVPVLDATEQQVIDAQHAHEHQYQVLDILSGRICPELGGSPDYLDILGFNYYYNNQWIVGTNQFLPWRNLEKDPRWRSLSSLLKEAHSRYDRPIALTETSHSAEDRPLWINFIGDEAVSLLEEGLPLWGICLYPIVDRPDWDHLHPWHRSGLWDAELMPGGKAPERVLHEPSAAALLETQALVQESINKARRPRKHQAYPANYDRDYQGQRSTYPMSKTL
jgi:hypothetical protein